MSRSRPHMPAQPTQGRGLLNSPFLRKKQKRNIILDEGEGNIPFSATKEFFKYEVFVTNLNTNSNINAIKDHLVTKLGTDDIFIKKISKPYASYLSLGVFCRSERSDIDFRLPGLWPRGTMIYKWNSKGGETRASNRAGSYQGQTRSHGSRGAGGNYHNQGPHFYNGRHSNSATDYKYRTSEQQRLHDQNV